MKKREKGGERERGVGLSSETVHILVFLCPHNSIKRYRVFWSRHFKDFRINRIDMKG